MGIVKRKGYGQNSGSSSGSARPHNNNNSNNNNNRLRNSLKKKGNRRAANTNRKTNNAAAATTRKTNNQTNANFQNEQSDENPLATWQRHWAAQGIGGANPLYGDSAFRQWFEGDYFNDMRNQFSQAQQMGTPKNMLYWNQWLANNTNAPAMQSAWGNLSMMKRGLTGSPQVKWMAF